MQSQRGDRTVLPLRRLCGGSAAGVPPSWPTGSDWRGSRAAAGRLGVRRVAGVTIWHERSKRSAAACASIGSVRQAGPSFAYPRRTPGPAIPGHGKGRPRDPRRHRRPDRVARRMETRRGETTATGRRLDAQRDSLAPRSGDAPCRLVNANLCARCRTGNRRPYLSGHRKQLRKAVAAGVSLVV